MVWGYQPPKDLLATGYIPQVFLRQFAHEVELGGVLEGFAGTFAFTRCSQNDTGILKSHQVPIQTRPRNCCGLSQLACSAWTPEGEASENFGLSAASDHAHHNFNLRREIGINEGGHITIMPDGSGVGAAIAPPYY